MPRDPAWSVFRSRLRATDNDDDMFDNWNIKSHGILKEATEESFVQSRAALPEKIDKSERIKTKLLANYRFKVSAATAKSLFNISSTFSRISRCDRPQFH